MNRVAFLRLTFTCLVLTAVSCSKSPVLQSKALDAHTTITLEDAWIFGTSNQLLRAKFAIEGNDPDQSYNLKATLRADENGEEIKSIYVWYNFMTTNSAASTNRDEMIWEFKYFPTNTPKIYLRQYYLDKDTNSIKETLDFVLPGTQNLRVRDASID